jgi:hypothetical protein
MTLITPSFKREFEIFNRNEPNFLHYFEQSHTSKLYLYIYILTERDLDDS